MTNRKRTRFGLVLQSEEKSRKVLEITMRLSNLVFKIMSEQQRAEVVYEVSLALYHGRDPTEFVRISKL